MTTERAKEFQSVNALELLKNKIRSISKKMEYDGESGYGGYVVYLDKDKDKIKISTHTNLSPYSAQASDEIKVSFNTPNKTMIIFSTNVFERFEDNNSFEKYGGIKYIFEPLTNKIASEILEKIKLFKGLEIAQRMKKFDNGGGVENKNKLWYEVLQKFFKIFYGDDEDDKAEKHINDSQVTTDQAKYYYENFMDKYKTERSLSDGYKVFKQSLTKDELDSIKVSFNSEDYADAEQHDTQKRYSTITIKKK